MYPRNASSPERIAVGQVILIADGTVQSASVTITVRGQGGSEGAGGGTTAFGADNTVYYTPTQAETNYTSFVVIASKASCLSVSQTVITTASVTPGKVVLSGETHTSAVIPTVSALAGHTVQTGDSFARIGANGASLTDLATAANLATVAGYLDTEIQTILDRIGTFTGTGINTILGFFLALMKSDASNPSDVGGTFDAATDAQEAIADSVAATAPLPYHPDGSSTVVTGTETNAYTDVASDNGTYWSAADAGAGIEMISEMNLGSGRVSTSLIVNGHFDSGGGRIVEVWYYDYVLAAHVKLSDGTAAKEMRNSASDNDYVFNLPQSATDRTTVPGEIKITFLAAQINATDELFLDLVEISGVASGATSPETIADAVATSAWGISMNHIPKFTGKVNYIAGSVGSDTNSGIYPDEGFATIGAWVTAASAGDFGTVFAESFTEAVVLNKNGLELHGEIGAIITGNGGVPLTISADYCRVDEIILTPAAGQIGLIISGDYNKVRVIRVIGGLTAVQDTGTGNEITFVAAEEYTATGFDLQGPNGYVFDCLAESTQASTRGFYLSNTLADGTVIDRAVSVGNDTAGFEVVTGVTGAMIFNSGESETCGARVDNGTNTSWRNHSRTDHQTLISALPTTAEVNAECDTALSDYDGPTNAEMEARTPTAAQLAYIIANAATGMPVTFTTAGGTTTNAVLNQVDGAGASATDDQYNGRLLVFTDGNLKGVVTDITDYDGTTKYATITAVTFVPTDSHNARLI